MKKTPDWMPVFVVLPATSEVAVSDDKTKSAGKYKNVTTGQDYWQRIGTAYHREDGNIYVNLDAVPVNGKLVIRPPKTSEQSDPTADTKKGR